MVKKLILLMCLWVPLSGCIPVAVVTAAAIGGAIVYDKRSFKTMSKDNHATMSAAKQVRAKKDLRGKAHVNVSVFNGVGLVVGDARSKKEKDEVGKIVAATPGVRRVYNEVSVKGDHGTLTNLNDTWLASKVRTNLLLKPGLRSANIKIITQASTVYLMGIVNKKQAALAAKTSSEVVGVKKVVKVFEYD